jgi:hypothetical protein
VAGIAEKLRGSQAWNENTRVIIPANLTNSHWMACILEVAERQIFVYDSLGNRGNAIELATNVAKIAKAVEMLDHRAPNTHKPTNPTQSSSEWKLITPDSLGPRQFNSSDCGWFTILNAWCSIHNKPHVFTQLSIQRTREIMTVMIKESAVEIQNMTREQRRLVSLHGLHFQSQSETETRAAQTSAESLVVHNNAMTPNYGANPMTSSESSNTLLAQNDNKRLKRACDERPMTGAIVKEKSKGAKPALLKAKTSQPPIRAFMMGAPKPVSTKETNLNNPTKRNQWPEANDSYSPHGMLGAHQRETREGEEVDFSQLVLSGEQLVVVPQPEPTDSPPP